MVGKRALEADRTDFYFFIFFEATYQGPRSWSVNGKLHSLMGDIRRWRGGGGGGGGRPEWGAE